jgi:ribonucleoside-diphosphate reductase alpha chain
MNDKNSAYDMRARILRRRYLWKDKNGKVIETEEKMCHRVALVIATVEKRYSATVEKMKSVKEKFYKLISTAIFLPNSPTLMNAGRKNGLLSACFVLPLLDSLKDILKAVMNTGLIPDFPSIS